jgi:hypothetical protein
MSHADDVNRSLSPAFDEVASKAGSLDPLVRYMIVNWALGALAGIVCATAMLLVDPFGLRPLLSYSDVAIAALFMLYFGFMTTFGGLVCAAAVMFPPKDDDPPRGGLRGVVTPANWKPRLAYASVSTRA